MDIVIKKPNFSEKIIISKKFNESEKEFIDNLKRKKEELLILIINNKISGVLKYKVNKNFSRVESMFLIQKKWRGKGVSQKIYAKYEKLIAGKKYSECYVYQTNKRALGFWLKNGYKIIKESKDNQGEKLYYMKKNLNSNSHQ